MPITGANDTSKHEIERSEFVQGGPCFPIYESPESGSFETRDRSFSAARDGEEESDGSCSESSSSIGRNSDDLSGGRSSSSNGDGESGDGEEVQSQFKGALDNMDALEEVLPVKRAISKFYCGKSKSFTSLADAASCSSIKDIVKPENAYTRKRKNLLAHHISYSKSHNHLPSCHNTGSGGISKRLANNSSRSLLSLSMLSGSPSNSNSESSSSNSSPPHRSLPPLPHGRRLQNKELSPPKQSFSTWRSHSMSDLRGAATTSTGTAVITTTGMDIRSGD